MPEPRKYRTAANRPVIGVTDDGRMYTYTVDRSPIGPAIAVDIIGDNHGVATLYLTSDAACLLYGELGSALEHAGRAA